MNMASLFLAMVVPWTSGLDFHVARDGSDANCGTSEAPFASLGRARDAIRELKAEGALERGVTVTVRQGQYALPRTLTLGKADSGTETAPIVYRASAGEKVDLLGGRPITGFVPYKGQILKADLSGQGFDGVRIRVLVFDGQRRRDCRQYPRAGAAGTDSRSLRAPQSH